MKHTFYLLAAIFAWSFTTACSSEVGSKYISTLSKAQSDSAIVQQKTALFLFRMDTGGLWRWYRDDTSMSELEFGWRAEFEFEGQHYSAGFSLFKHPFATPKSGSFKSLIKDGQVDVFKRNKPTAPKSFGDGSNRVAFMISASRMQYARVETIIDSNALIVVLRERDIIEKFHEFRPDSVTFRYKTPEHGFISQKVAVTYATGFTEDHTGR